MADNMIKDVFGFGLLAVGAYFVYEYFFSANATNSVIPTPGPTTTPQQTGANVAIVGSGTTSNSGGTVGVVTGGSGTGNQAGTNNQPVNPPSLATSTSGSVFSLMNQAISSGTPVIASTLMNIDQWAYYWNILYGNIPAATINLAISAEGGDRTRTMTAGQFAQLIDFVNGMQGAGVAGLGRTYVSGYGGLGIIGAGYNVNALSANVSGDASSYELAHKVFM